MMTNIFLLDAWVGTFQPAAAQTHCADCAKPKIEPGPGTVRILTRGDGTAPPQGEVVIVSPLLGVVARGKAEAGKLAVAWFNYDLRDGDDGVLVLPGDTPIGLVEVTGPDVGLVKHALLKDEVLSGVPRSLAGIELGGIDTNGDGKPDYVVTYGCNAWGDGLCQSKGQFFLVRRGAIWVEID